MQQIVVVHLEQSLTSINVNGRLQWKEDNLYALFGLPTNVLALCLRISKAIHHLCRPNFTKTNHESIEGKKQTIKNTQNLQQSVNCHQCWSIIEFAKLQPGTVQLKERNYKLMMQSCSGAGGLTFAQAHGHRTIAMTMKICIQFCIILYATKMPKSRNIKSTHLLFGWLM